MQTNGKDVLIARFPAGKGPIIRTIITRREHLFCSKNWEQDGNSGKFTGGLARPDDGNEESEIRFFYDVEDVKIEMEKFGEASVEVHLPGIAT